MTREQTMPALVVIIGAARSGTNMLRDILTALPGFGTWPCDEINAIWRYGNTDATSDCLSEAQAREDVRRYIRKAFRRIAARRGCEIVVEKTCANSLRVDFVDAVVPEAKYLFLVRDGRDVVTSAMRRWSASPDLSYLARKARFVPAASVPHYVFSFAKNQAHRLLGPQRRLAAWGPRFEGMHQALEERSLAEVCALQWRECLTAAAAGLDRLDVGRVHTIRYEHFVKDPMQHVHRILRFLNVDVAHELVQRAKCGVTSSSVGRWREHLDPVDQARVLPIINGTLHNYGYDGE